jgi:hypothetical protein
MKDVLSKGKQIIQAVDNYYISELLICYSKIATIGQVRAAICDETAHATNFLIFPSGIIPTHLELYRTDAATSDTMKLSADPRLTEPDNYENYGLKKRFFLAKRKLFLTFLFNYSLVKLQ